MPESKFKNVQEHACDTVEDLLPLKKLCPRCKPNPNFIQPNWTSMVDETYYNEATCEYEICVIKNKHANSVIIGVDKSGVSTYLPDDPRERRHFLRKYIHPALEEMLFDMGKLVADQIICASHEGPRS